jgi:hypothetical protein
MYIRNSGIMRGLERADNTPPNPLTGFVMEDEMAKHQSISIPTLSMKDTIRFWAKIDQSGGPNSCHEWQGCRTRGYGHFGLGGRVVYAHRVAWTIANGPIPDGLDVLHNCPEGDNPACCNQRHLWVGTHIQNMRDRGGKGRTAIGDSNGTRSRPETRPRGENHPSAKLTWAQVQEIRAKYIPWVKSQAQLASEFGITKGTVFQILHGEIWVINTKIDELARREETR